MLQKRYSESIDKERDTLTARIAAVDAKHEALLRDYMVRLQSTNCRAQPFTSAAHTTPSSGCASQKLMQENSEMNSRAAAAEAAYSEMEKTLANAKESVTTPP